MNANTKTRQVQPAAFGLHIPKAAGSSLLSSFRQVLPSHRIYQNTSLFENFRLNRPEFYELSNYDDIVFFWGHHIHEEMLRAACLSPSYSRTSERPFILFTGLREPVGRTKSDLAFNIRLNADFDRSFNADEYIRTIGDKMCHLIVGSFPTLCGSEGELWERAARGLANFGLVYTTDTLQECLEIVCRFVWIKPIAITSSNVSESWEVEQANRFLHGLEDHLAERMPNDMKLFQWVSENLQFGKQVAKLKEGGGWQRILETLGPSKDESRLASFLSYNLFLEFENLGLLARLEKQLRLKRDNLATCLHELEALKRSGEEK